MTFKPAKSCAIRMLTHAVWSSGSTTIREKARTKALIRSIVAGVRSRRIDRFVGLLRPTVSVFLLMLFTGMAAFAGPTPGSSTDYTWQPGTVLTSLDFVINVKTDPGTQSNVFWSSQFNFSDQTTAYTGMQSNGGAPRTFLFSAWDAKGSRPGSKGSFCVPFAENGSGRSCRIHRAWHQGHGYRFHVAHEEGRWFGVTVTDTHTGEAFKLGSILTRAQSIDIGNMSNWTEYFEWNFDSATCTNQPYSSAEFMLPTGNDGVVTATVGSSEASKTCPQFTHIETTSAGTLHVNGVGNSLRMPVRAGEGLCLDARGGSEDGTPAVTFRCTGKDNQAWVLGTNGNLALADNLCIGTRSQAHVNAAVFVLRCSSGAMTQQWRYLKSTIRATGSALCLTAHGSDVQLTTSRCSGKQNQAWLVGEP